MTIMVIAWAFREVGPKSKARAKKGTFHLGQRSNFFPSYLVIQNLYIIDTECECNVSSSPLGLGKLGRWGQEREGGR